MSAQPAGGHQETRAETEKGLVMQAVIVGGMVVIVVLLIVFKVI